MPVGEPELDGLRALAHAALGMIGDPRRGNGSALGRAVALEDDHAQVFPVLLQCRRQVRAGTDHQVEPAAQLLVDAAEDQPARPVGQVTRDPARPVEGLVPTLALDLALQPQPEQLEQLRHEDHRRDLLLAQRVEDDARRCGFGRRGCARRSSCRT